MRLHKLLSLLHLPIKHIRGKEPLIVYFKSHVVIFAECLNILREKTMDKANKKEIREGNKG
jgi:hypothetical protein